MRFLVARDTRDCCEVQSSSENFDRVSYYGCRRRLGKLCVQLPSLTVDSDGQSQLNPDSVSELENRASLRA